MKRHVNKMQTIRNPRTLFALHNSLLRGNRWSCHVPVIQRTNHKTFERSSWNEYSTLKCNERFTCMEKAYFISLLILLFYLLLFFNSFSHLKSLVLYQEPFLKPPHWSWLPSLKQISNVCSIPGWRFLSKNRLKNGKFLLTGKLSFLGWCTTTVQLPTGK